MVESVGRGWWWGMGVGEGGVDYSAVGCEPPAKASDGQLLPVSHRLRLHPLPIQNRQAIETATRHSLATCPSLSMAAITAATAGGHYRKTKEAEQFGATTVVRRATAASFSRRETA